LALPDDRESWRAPAHLVRPVLVVDDEPLLLKSAERMLVARGLNVLGAIDGPSALRKAEQVGELELLVTDLCLPGMDGVELARHLRRWLPSLKVLFVSGLDAGQRRVTLPSDGTWTFLPKPFRGGDLDQRLRLLLGPAGEGSPERSG
jgi:two-component system, cell cycle sensor histidine kinase and response regulator CckA